MQTGLHYRHVASRAIGYVGAWATGTTAGLILLRIGTEPGRLSGAAIWGLVLLFLDVLADRVPYSKWVSAALIALGSFIALPFLVSYAAGHRAVPPLSTGAVVAVAVLLGLLQLGLRALCDALTGPPEPHPERRSEARGSGTT